MNYWSKMRPRVKVRLTVIRQRYPEVDHKIKIPKYAIGETPSNMAVCADFHYPPYLIMEISSAASLTLTPEHYPGLYELVPHSIHPFQRMDRNINLRDQKLAYITIR